MSTKPVDILSISSVQKRRFPAACFIAGVFILFAAEVAVFFGASYWLGWRFLVNVSVVTGVLGLCVIGLAVVRYAAVVARRLDQDECLDDELSAGLLLLVAGVLLLLPGIITDTLGLVLLLPATRRFHCCGASPALCKRRALRRSRRWCTSGAFRIEEPVAAAEGEEARADPCLPDEDAGRLKEGKASYCIFAGVGKCSRLMLLLNPSRQPKACSAVFAFWGRRWSRQLERTHGGSPSPR